MTDEWEHRFDQLIDWMLWHKENQQRFSWLGIDWGQRGGITGGCGHRDVSARERQRTCAWEGGGCAGGGCGGGDVRQGL